MIRVCGAWAPNSRGGEFRMDNAAAVCAEAVRAVDGARDAL